MPIKTLLFLPILLFVISCSEVVPETFEKDINRCVDVCPGSCGSPDAYCFSTTRKADNYSHAGAILRDLLTDRDWETK